MSNSKKGVDFEGVKNQARAIENEIVNKRSGTLQEIKDRIRSILGGVDYLRDQRNVILNVPFERETVIARGKGVLKGKREQVLKDLLLPELQYAQDKKTSPFVHGHWPLNLKAILTPEAMFYLLFSEDDLDGLAGQLPPGGITPEVETRIKQIDDQLTAYAAELEELQQKAVSA